MCDEVCSAVQPLCSLCNEDSVRSKNQQTRLFEDGFGNLSRFMHQRFSVGCMCTDESTIPANTHVYWYRADDLMVDS